MAPGTKACIFLALVPFILCVAFIIIKGCIFCLNGGLLISWRQPIEIPTEGGDSRPPVVPSGGVSSLGMDLASIRSLRAFQHMESVEDASVREISECSICFTRFHQGEWLRLLPNCTHAFHLTCIDPWLRSSPTCPLCRTNVLWDFGVIPMETLEREGVSQETPLNYRFSYLGYMIRHSGEEDE